MKKYILVLFFFIFVNVGFINAQQLPLYSQYMMNDFFINPAIAGTKEYSPLVLSIHKQWVGIENSPSTQTLSYHTLMPNKTTGLGGIIFHDSFGPESHLGLQFIYSYHLSIDKYNKISFGLAALAMQYKMDQRFFELTEYYDPAITYRVEKTIIPDANLGIYFYGAKYSAGITVAQLFQSKLKINKNVTENKMVRHYYVMGGYKFKFNDVDLWEIEPSILLKFTELTPPQLDFNTKIYYDKNFWFGISVRPNDSFIMNIGFKHNQYYIGYAYDFTFSNLSRHSSGSQEIIFGMNLNERPDRRRSKGKFF